LGGEIICLISTTSCYFYVSEINTKNVTLENTNKQTKNNKTTKQKRNKLKTKQNKNYVVTANDSGKHL
jgi:hypothetical protein